MSTIIFHVASPHCVIMRQCSDKIWCCSSVVLCQVPVHPSLRSQVSDLPIKVRMCNFPVPQSVETKCKTSKTYLTLGCLSNSEQFRWDFVSTYLKIWNCSTGVEIICRYENSYEKLLKNESLSFPWSLGKQHYEQTIQSWSFFTKLGGQSDALKRVDTVVCLHTFLLLTLLNFLPTNHDFLQQLVPQQEVPGETYGQL